MTDIDFQTVRKSDTLDAVAFFPELGDLLVRFKRTNAVYLYKGADEALFKHLVNTPHPWSKFQGVVKALPYELISKGLLQEPRKTKRVVIKGGTKVEAPKVEEAAPKVVAKRGPGRPRGGSSLAKPKVKVEETAEAEKPKRTRAPRKPAVAAAK